MILHVLEEGFFSRWSSHGHTVLLLRFIKPDLSKLKSSILLLIHFYLVFVWATSGAF